MPIIKDGGQQVFNIITLSCLVFYFANNSLCLCASVANFN
jgi:hypothetical protein